MGSRRFGFCWLGLSFCLGLSNALEWSNDLSFPLSDSDSRCCPDAAPPVLPARPSLTPACDAPPLQITRGERNPDGRSMHGAAQVASWLRRCCSPAFANLLSCTRAATQQAA